MNTNFFSNLAQIQENLKLSLTISFDPKSLMASVSIHPIGSENSDPATSKIMPLILSGTLQDLDDNFFESIQKPISETVAFFNNTEEYLKTKKSAEKQSQIEKDQKQNIKKLEEQLDGITSDENYKPNDHTGNKALLKAQELRALDPNNKKAKAAVEIIKAAQSQKNLF